MKPKHIIRYKIFEIERGLLVEPMRLGEPRFPDMFDSLEEAIQELNETETIGNYVVLPFTDWSWSES